MKLTIALALLAGLLSTGAYAQWDSAQLGTGQVMPAAIKAQSDRNVRRGGSVSARARGHCANLPEIRKQYGSGNPKVLQLARLCRQAGY